MPTATITMDENGLPVLSVTLHSMKRWNTTKTFRFLLDTGASWCIVDRSVPSDYFWDEPQTETTTHDIANQSIPAPTVLLKRVEVGTLSRDGVIATRMDLQSQLGRFEDKPVDGILGMSFLRGTRFLVDSKAGRLVWWGYHFTSGVTIRLLEGQGEPRITLRLGTEEVPATVDTGMSGGVDLPGNLRPKVATRDTVSIGLSGTRIAGSEARVSRLETGSSAWVDLPVDFNGEAGSGRVGVDVWFAAPVCFDFITNHLTLSVDAYGNLPIRREPSRKLPLVWDRSGAIPRLLVLLVKPGSVMESVGCMPGDELIQVGDLKGSALTRRGVQDLVASGARPAWTVRRNGQVIQLGGGPS